MQSVYNPQGKRFWLDKNIGSGGEADVWTIDGYPDLVAKIYSKKEKTTPQQEAKVRAMVANPLKPAHTHIDIAWPVELLYEQNQFVGFLMPYLQGSAPIFNFYNLTTRNKKYPRLNQKSLYNIALNLTIAVGNLHAKGHVIGDVNESNILVNEETLVTIIDTDSFQISEQRGQIHHCQVGKPEYTPPELQGVDFKTVNRTKNHDNFGLAILIFQLLMEGVHPFNNIGIDGPENNIIAIKQGIFPYQNEKGVTPPPNAPSFEELHSDVRSAFIRCFVDGHRNPYLRPTAKEWKKILQKAKKALSPSIQTIITPKKPPSPIPTPIPQKQISWIDKLRSFLSPPLTPLEALLAPLINMFWGMILGIILSFPIAIWEFLQYMIDKVESFFSLSIGIILIGIILFLSVPKLGLIFLVIITFIGLLHGIYIWSQTIWWIWTTVIGGIIGLIIGIIQGRKFYGAMVNRIIQYLHLPLPLIIGLIIVPFVVALGIIFNADKPPIPQLTVQSNVDNNTVFIDSKNYGSTPLNIELPQGSHTIRIEKPDYIPYKTKINLQETQILRAELQRYIVNVPDPFLIPPPPPPRFLDCANLTINAYPSDSQIRIMNIKSKYKPGICLETGKYEIEVTHEGYQENRQWITVNSDMSINITLKKIKCIGNKYSLIVNAHPSDSRIRIMNIKPKYKPGICLKSGKYKIEVAHKGYQKHEQLIPVNSDTSINITLTAK